MAEDIRVRIEELGLTKDDIKLMALNVLADDEVLDLADLTLDKYAKDMEDPEGKMIDRTVVASRVRSAQQLVRKAKEIVTAD